jgi:hypothetical protein
MHPYQRINLTNFIRLSQPILINDFFSHYEQPLRQIRKSSGKLFFNEYGKKKELRVAQRYIAKCPEELYYLFNEWSESVKFNPVFGTNEIIPTLNEPQNPDYNPPGRINTIVSRIIRDTELSRKIKLENNWRCQICGDSILLPNTNYYSEGHHLQPLGGEHQGPDVRQNIIILCPTHHTEFDYGSIAINPSTNLIEHIDINCSFHNQQIAYKRSDLSIEYLSYHYNKRFNNKSTE